MSFYSAEIIKNTFCKIYSFSSSIVTRTAKLQKCGEPILKELSIQYILNIATIGQLDIKRRVF